MFGDYPFDFFIMISSIAWVVGNPGQSNYSAANGFMAGLAMERRKRGLAASVMSIGVVAGVGYLARTKGGHEHEHAKRRNVMTISEDELHTIFAEAIVAGRPDSGHDSELIAGLDGAIDTSVTARESLSTWLSDPRVSHIVVDKADEAVEQTVLAKAEAVTLKQQLHQSSSHNDSLSALVCSFSIKLERMLLVESASILESVPLVELGVDSLTAVEIRSWFKVELNIDVPILKILGGATVAGLSAEVLTRFEASTKAIVKSAETPAYSEAAESQLDDSDSSNGAIDTPTTEDELYKISRKVTMSFAQARMWRVHEHTVAARVSNLTVAYRIDGQVDVRRFQDAFNIVVQGYESLRTRFFNDEVTKEATQEVMASSSVKLILKRVATEKEVDAQWERINNCVYDLPGGKTTRFYFLSVSDAAHVFIAGFHHIVLDTRSIEILLADLHQAYRGLEVAFSRNHPADHAILEQTYLKTSSWEDSISYWKNQHLNRTLILPLFPFSLVNYRQPMLDYRLHCFRHDLNSSTSTAIKRICSSLKISPYHFHTTVFQVLLYRLLGIRDLCLGSVDANRTSHDYLNTFGPMFNYLPIRFQVSPSDTFSSLARSTRTICYTAAGHAHVPFDVILDSLNIERMPETHHPLYQAQINYLRHTIEEVPLGEDLVMRERNASGVDISYDFCVSVLETKDGARVLFHAQEYLYSVESLEWLADTYFKLLKKFLEDPGLNVGVVEIGEVPTRK